MLIYFTCFSFERANRLNGLYYR